MFEHYEKRYFKHYTTNQLYELVLDVVAYPEFLPWCVGAKILETHKDCFVADLEISFATMREHYHSRVTFSEPKQINGKGVITAIHVEGPFKILENHWIFTPDEENKGCYAEIDIKFAFHSKLLEKLVGAIFHRASQKMIKAFEDRATAIYG